MIKTAIFIAIFFGMQCASAWAGDEVEPVSGSENYYLEEPLLEKTKHAAFAGDADAAYKVYQHYELGVGDTLLALPWVEIAASRGNANAQYTLGYIYSQFALLKNVDIARYWLKRASKSGITQAEELLDEINSELNGPSKDRRQ